MPTLCHVWEVASDEIHAASAAGIWFDTISAKKVRIARYCAMLSMYAVAGTCGAADVAGIRVKYHVLKAQNVSSRVIECEEILHGKLDSIGFSCTFSLL